MEPYGAFVELAPNLAGLAELREFSREELLSGVGKTCRTKDVDLEVVREALKYIVSLTSRR